MHFTRGDSSPVSSLNRTDRSSAGRAAKKLNSNAATLSTTKKLKKNKETSCAQRAKQGPGRIQKRDGHGSAW